MAAFIIHEDQENSSLALRKDITDVFSAAPQRRALGDLGQFTCNQNRNVKLPGLTNGPCKVQDENRTVRQIKNEKNIVPPVAQFRAFSVYEDDTEAKKREPYKPYVSKETRKDNYFVTAAENARALCAQIDKQPDLPKDGPELRLSKQEKNEDNEKDVVESPMSVVDSSILSMSISKNESLNLEENLEDEDATTAQTDKEMFFHVAEYRQDIYEYMKEIEVLSFDLSTPTSLAFLSHYCNSNGLSKKTFHLAAIKNRPNPRYMRKQPDITHMMRSILIDWLVEVCDEYKQQSETLHLAVSYVDRFLSYMSVVRTKLQLVGTAATYIAAKYEEVFPPDVSEFVYITDDTYKKRDVLRMEHLILKVLSFDLSTPTSLAFLSHYCISNGLSKKTFHLAAYIAELSLLEADPYLQYRPSLIAAAALATARHCLLCERSACAERADGPHPLCAATAWPSALAACSGYSLGALAGCARELARTHAHAAHQPHQAIVDKYKGNKFDSVSSIEPRPMYPVAQYQPPAPAPAARPDASRATS